MALETLERMKKRIAQSDGIAGDDKAALADLLAELEAEIEHLPEDHHDHMKTVAGFAELSALEASKTDTDEDLLHHALDGMRKAAERFGENHPKVVRVVSDVAKTVGRMGF